MEARTVTIDQSTPAEAPPYHTEAYGPSPDTRHLATPAEALAADFAAAIRFGIGVETDYYGNGQDDERYIEGPASRRAKAFLAALPAPWRLTSDPPVTEERLARALHGIIVVPESNIQSTVPEGTTELPIYTPKEAAPVILKALERDR